MQNMIRYVAIYLLVSFCFANYSIEPNLHDYATKTNVRFPYANHSFSGKFANLKFDIDILEDGYVVNNYYDNIEWCLVENDKLINCVVGYNILATIVIPVPIGTNFYEIVAKIRGDEMSISRDSFYITRLELSVDQESISKTAFPVEQRLNTATITLPLEYHPMYYTLESLEHIYAPLSTSIAFVTEPTCADEAKRPHEMETYLSLLLSPERIYRYSIGFGCGIKMNNCGSELNAAIVHSRYGSLLDGESLPPMVHVSIVRILRCGSVWEIESADAVRDTLDRLEMLKKRTSGHYVVILSKECINSNFLPDTFLNSAHQRFDYDDAEQSIFIFINPAVELIKSNTERRSRPEVEDIDWQSRVILGDSLQLHREHPEHVEQGSDLEMDGGSGLRANDNNNGLHSIKLENMCLLSNNDIILFNRKVNTNNNAVFPASLRETLKRRGFLPWLGQSRSSLVELNVGSRYSNVGAREVESKQLFDKGTNIRWIGGQSVLIRPYFRDNIFHLVQSVAALIDSISWGIPFTPVSDHVPNARTVYMLEYNMYVLEWCDSFIELVSSWLGSRLHHDSDPITSYHSQAVVDALHQDYLIQTHAQADELSDNKFVTAVDSGVVSRLAYYANGEFHQDTALCFREGILMAQGDSDVGFFHNKSMLQRFRSHVWTQLSPVEVRPSTWNRDTSPPIQSKQRKQYENKRKEKRLIKVTMGLRKMNRLILNYGDILRLLGVSAGSTHITGSPFADILDYDWLNAHSNVVMETLSFREQIDLMRETDIFIGAHGSVFTNGLFMKPYSVVIALMQSRHIEFVLPQVLQQADIKFDFVPVLNQSHTGNCGPKDIDYQGKRIIDPTHIYPLHCEESTMQYRDEHGIELDTVTVPTSIVRAGYMDCLGIRSCDVTVDLTLLDYILHSNIKYLYAFKFNKNYNADATGYYDEISLRKL